MGVMVLVSYSFWCVELAELAYGRVNLNTTSFFFFLLWTLVFLCFFLHHRGVQVYVFVISNSLNSYLTLLNKSTTKLLSRRSWNLWCCISDGFSVYESQDSISHSNDDWQWWQLSLLFTLIKAGKEWIFRFIRPNA